jgi:general secretion pathway protein J
MQSSRGFTLIEVLVSLAMMGIIATVLVASLQIGGHSWKRVTRTATNVEEIARAQQLLRQSLSSAHLVADSDDPAVFRPSLIGTPTTLEFSSMSPTLSDDALMRFRVGLAEVDPTTIEVSYCRERNRASGSMPCDWSREVLITKVAGLSIQFWAGASGVPGYWISGWEDRAKPPRLIRIEVQFEPGDPRRWPPLYIEPRVDANAQCAFDVVSRRCRDST